jgi:hypothetical protein
MAATLNTGAIGTLVQITTTAIATANPAMGLRAVAMVITMPIAADTASKEFPGTAFPCRGAWATASIGTGGVRARRALFR